MNKKVYHIISNTHWDREWRYPFQRNRRMLVDMIDKVLEILEKEPSYKAFHLDSQSIVLKDYLEIKPKNKDKIVKFIKQKRLFVGPWYILPDEFLVGGENLIRNLLLGHKTANEYGRVSKMGYSPFSWGQISQLPQIYAGFNIDVIMFYRGVNSIDSPKAEFIWEGADGTKALTSRFSTMPRYNFYFYIYRPVIHNEGFNNVEYKWERGGIPFHIADTDVKEDYYIIDPVDSYYKENIVPSVKAIIKNQAKDFTTSNVIWMEGHDSSGPNIKTTAIIKDIHKLLPDLDVRHSTLEDYANALKKEVNFNKLPLVEGERRSSQYDNRSGNMFAYTLSARMYLKQMNFNTERNLIYYAEPLNTISNILGLDTNDNFLDLAWNLLIQNSAHDSIGGCSLDDVHDEMVYRYRQTNKICEAVIDRAFKHIALNLNHSKFVDKDSSKSIYLNLYNPLPYQVNEVYNTFIDIPKDYDKGSIKIVDEEGNEIEMQIINSFDKEPVLEQMIDRPMYFSMKRYNCILATGDVPSLGFKSFMILPDSEKKESSNANIAKKDNGSTFLENEYLKVEINNNGSLNIYQKETGAAYKKMGYLYDEGEAGHAWVHTPVKPFITSINGKAKIKILNNGNLSASCSVKYKLRVPKNLEARKKKQNELVDIEIELLINLTKYSKYVELIYDVDNKAEAHRLRAMFPLNSKAEYSCGEGEFDIVKRRIKREDTSDWVEQPMYDYPMHHFVDVSDNKKGVSVLVDGLKEYEVYDNNKNTLAITLFRAFNYVIQPSSKEDYSYLKGSQCLGKNKYRMAIYPHKDNLYSANTISEAFKFNYKLKSFQTGKLKGNLEQNISFINIDNSNIILSCLKESENKKGYIIRLNNLNNLEEKVKVSFGFAVKKAYTTTLEEKSLKRISVKNNSVMLDIEPKKIITIYLEK